ncbi:TIGR04282 family arsenosugar biosynthesis glycosyltransferase [Hanstruepera marina]|uniref:TIGR04282 family arsenosugar biosynthesis glycosyltransferase n=1 Tax=Hanstruepera marina TaxID=2873265 RepID=UPI001CA69BAF|nr:TIGR04282 family arsenosugar biosynthesis glycosyltransferase [Hanstruepera marina]
MSDNLVIVFVKNIKLGKVKTRLAKTIGDQEAFEVYKLLVKKTEKATQNLLVDTHIYFSDAVIVTKWPNTYKTVQKGNDLGERMKNAFKDGFEKGYKNIVLIGSDLPDISEVIINQAFESLKTHDTVFGPAEDGGYYLVGIKNLNHTIFDNKPWSDSNLLNKTIEELNSSAISIGLLQTLNDIDTFEDLKTSSIYNTYLHDKIHN